MEAASAEKRTPVAKPPENPLNLLFILVVNQIRVVET